MPTGTSSEEYDKKLQFINQEQLRRLEVIEGLSISYESILYVDLDTDKILPYRMGSRTERQFEGSRFTVTLRLRIQSSQESKPEELRQALLKEMGTRKLLLVDDNQINLEIETELLEDVGFQVETAENGLEAVKKLQDAPGRYGLVLMDIQMPVMNGYEAAKAVREMENPQCSSIPIIALSANAFAEDRYQSRESGMNAHMAKPADIPKLLELMGQVLRVGEPV